MSICNIDFLRNVCNNEITKKSLLHQRGDIMATNKRAFTMRMQAENFEKIKIIAECNKRSIAMQIEYLIRIALSSMKKNMAKLNFSKTFLSSPY